MSGFWAPQRAWAGWCSRWLPRAAVLLYALPLLAAPLLPRANDVVAQADAASYLQLVDRFDLSRIYGDHWEPRRTTPVVAQEHKVKHVLYVLGASLAVRLGRPLGLSTLVVTQLLNALFAAMALAVFLRLLALYEVPDALAVPLAGLYATAPGQWVYASVPESWPLSGLLTVCLLFVAKRWPGAPFRLGALAGLAMLNNPVLGCAALLACTGPQASPSLRARVRDGALAVAAAVLVWCGVLTLLSAFDPAFRPDHYLAFLRWFRSVVGENGDAPIWVLRHALMNTVLLPFASSTANHDLSLAAVEETWGGSFLGRVALSAIALFWLTVGVVVAHWMRSRASGRTPGWAVLGPLAFLSVLLVSYCSSSPRSMLLYSSTTIPVLLLLAALFLAPRRWTPALVWVVWLACMPAAVQQMHWYRKVAFESTLPVDTPYDPAWPGAD
jgi:hypothetical protein